ncbi:MAG TPA: hypothetical protein VFZ65_17170 [Planctomycetota bacterium]|nr:hypothetical protein [Planctomycetota bacterium]
MPGPIIFLIVIAVIALLAVAAYFGWKAEKERREALAALADELGLRFDAGDDADHDDYYAQFEIFRRGHSRVARNTLLGTLELFAQPCRVRCGDFRYKVTRSNGKSTSTSTYRFSYVIVHPPWDTPPLLIRPEGLFDKIKGAFGFDDIDFESDEFSRKFFVQSTDKRFAYDVLHPRMMEFLLAEQPPMLDIEDGALCLSDGQRRWDPAGFRRQIAFLRRFCDLWPRHLVKDLNA